MLKVRDLSASYGSLRALREVTLDVGDGECVALIGPNGAGKTTLLNVLSGVHRAESGDVELDGRSVVGLPPNAIVRLGLIHVPEGRRIFGSLSVLENLQLAASPRFDRDRFNADLDFVFQLFPILEERRRRSGAQLSGGQQQMLAIARGIVAHPTMMVLDEPTLGLAPVTVDEMVAALARIRERAGLTMLLVEQHAGVLGSLVSRVSIMRGGRIIVANASPEISAEELRELYLGMDEADREEKGPVTLPPGPDGLR